MRGTLDHCVKCTICETFCPVANVTPLFPGPKTVGPQAERFRVRGEDSQDHSLDYCSGCGVCTQVCPQGVHIAEINTQARASSRSATASRCGTGSSPARRCSAGRHARRPAGQQDAVQSAAAPARREADRRPPRGRGADLRRPNVPGLGEEAPVAARGAARRLLPRLRGQLVRAGRGREDGWAPGGDRLPGRRARGQSCCGLPLQSNGQFDAARKYVRTMAKRLAPAARAGVDILGTSTSCTLMLKREAREILDLMEDPDLKVSPSTSTTSASTW